MEKITLITSKIVPLNIEDIDTDQIIPARFLKSTVREGFGKQLFYDWRFNSLNQPYTSFVLNNEPEGSILVAGKNFGCGSSREHAAWALYDYGFRVVISSFFADIFKNNALNNGILPIQVSEKMLQIIFDLFEKNKKIEIQINLPEQLIEIKEAGIKENFEINPYKKSWLINGFDDIDYLLSLKENIEEYEKRSAYLNLLKY